MITLTLTILFLICAVGWIAEVHFSRVERKARLQAVAALHAANEQLHAVTASSMRGHPLVRLNNPKPTPASDKWHYYARFEGVGYRFTEEALRTARERDESLRAK
jgi:hypothetical protein